MASPHAPSQAAIPAMRRARTAWLAALLVLAWGTCPAAAQAVPDGPATSEALAVEDAPVPSPAEAARPEAMAEPRIGEGTAGSAAPDAGAPALPDGAVPATSPAGPAAADNAGDRPSVRATLPHDLSPWGMFMAADWVVKGVMIALVLASVLVWTVWLTKSVELATARRRAKRALVLLGTARSLAEATEKVGFLGTPAAAMVRAATQELHLSADALDRDGVKERVASQLERIEAAAGRRMAAATGILANIGSTAPFVGLFGTVWGIMNSFIGISTAQTTNLAVVAPGIAEALLATAAGLIAAIPAVVIYNLLVRSIAGCRALLADASAEIRRLVSRDLDRGALRHASAAE